MEEVILMGYITRDRLGYSTSMEKTEELVSQGMSGILKAWHLQLAQWGGNREPLIMESYEYKTCQDIEKQ